MSSYQYGITGLILIVVAIYVLKLPNQNVDITAHVYKHLENGALVYCDRKQTTHVSYSYLGTAKLPRRLVGRCYFS